MSAGGARAEILPDDDDKELLALAKANRKNRIAAEQKLEREVFGASGQSAGGSQDPQIAVLQKVVGGLAVLGKRLAEGAQAPP